MPVAAFEPKYMKVGVLTAALQELTPREKRDPDPDLAVEEWAAFAREVGADYMQLSAALHPTVADVPAEALLDPVANTLDLREPFTRDRALRVQKALDDNRVGLSDLGYFDDMSCSEIGAQLGIPVGTVKSRVRRALSLLRQKLGDGAGGAS